MTYLNCDMEIDARTNGGISVTLLGHFNGSGKCEFAKVKVSSANLDFTLDEIPLDRALEVYRHPFVYADRELTAGKI